MQAIKKMDLLKITDFDKYCPICKKEKKIQIIDFGGGIKKEVPILCKCQSKHIYEYEKQNELEKKLERKRRLERLFQQSRVGERFKDCSFENFKVRQGTETAYETAKDYVKNFTKYRKDGRGILFSSIPGTGKTHICGAVTSILLKNLTSVIFVVVPELLQKIRSTYGYGKETEAQIIYGLTECDLLILDDLGAEKTTDWTMEKLFTVIDSRYRNNKPMICTTNCNSDELVERIGRRTFSRIMESCKPVKLTCDDYRLRKF